MKKLFTILFVAVALLSLAVSCYNDKAVWTSIDDLKGRVSRLEEQMKTANDNISALQGLVDALGKKLTVTSIEEKDGVYTINFSEGQPITIKDGVSPKVGVKQDADGVWYWTLNGEWLLDDNGGKLRVTGEDGVPGTPGTPGTPGENAIAPKLRIEEGWWYISTDDGVTWTQLGKATGDNGKDGKDGQDGKDGENGKDGDSFFQSVTWEDAYLYITLADGSQLALSRGTYCIRQIAVVPDYSDGSVMIDGNEVTLRFDVCPAAAAASLSKLTADSYSLNVVYARTKAVPGEELELTVTGAEIAGGRITLTVDTSALDESFLNGELGAVANLTVTYDEYNQVMTGYFPIFFFDKYAGHEYVDLGLSVKWATCNVGASKPEDYGKYFAWGEILTKSDYSWSTYKWCKGGETSLTKYCPLNKTDKWGGSGSPDGKTVLNLEDDVASVKWGGFWRMPTDTEWEELIENCTWTWKSNYNATGIAGYIVKSEKSEFAGNSIFLPSAGLIGGTDFENLDTNGYYWSSSLDTGTPFGAWLVRLMSDRVIRASYKRYCGTPIRPVIE